MLHIDYQALTKIRNVGAFLIAYDLHTKFRIPRTMFEIKIVLDHFKFPVDLIFYAHILETLNRKNFISFTPLRVILKALSFALNDSAKAFVLRLSK